MDNWSILPRARYRRISALVHIPWASVGSETLATRAAVRWARTLPSSTPHWSNESIFQMTPWVNTLCSYNATSAPSVNGVSRSASTVLVGRLPSQTRCETSVRLGRPDVTVLLRSPRPDESRALLGRDTTQHTSFQARLFKSSSAGSWRLAHLVQLPYSFCVKWPS